MDNTKSNEIVFPKQRVNRTANIPIEIDKKMGKLAAKSGENGVSKSAYMGALVENAVSQGVVFIALEDGRTIANRKRKKVA